MTLFDEHDQLALLKELTADVLQEDKDLLRELISVISNWKNDLVSPKQAYALAKDAKYQTFANVMSVMQRKFVLTMRWILMI